MAILESNTDLDVKGRVLATTVPNSTGSIVTWNASTKVFGLRTNAQIISDLGLQSSLTQGNHINITGNVISVKPTLNTWIEDSGNNNRILMSTVSSGTNHNDMVLKQISSDGYFKLRNAQDEDFFVYKNNTQELMMPLVGTSSSTVSNILMLGSNGTLWKSNRTIGDLIQNLSNGSVAGQINISGGGTPVTLHDLSRTNLIDFNDVSSIKTGSFTTFFNTTGSTGYPNAAGQGVMSLRRGTTQGSFALWVNNSDSDGKLYLNIGSSTGWQGWESIASREWVTQQTGNLPSLTTTDKSNLVDAINEVNGNIPTDVGIRKTIRRNVSGSYRRTVIPLVLLDNTSISRDSYFFGEVHAKRNNALDGLLFTAKISAGKLYNSETPVVNITYGKDYGGITFKPVTFTYNGLKYFGIDLGSTGANFTHATIDGISDDWSYISVINYLDTQNNIVLNQEISDSITDYVYFSDDTNKIEKSLNKIESEAFIKNGGNGSNILLDDGNVKAVSDFALAGSLGSYLPLAGGTMVNASTINWDFIGRLSIGGNYRLRFDSVNTFLSANNGTIYLRPQGDSITTNQITIDSNGQINTDNHGNSSQWKQAYDWGNYGVHGLGQTSINNGVYSSIDYTNLLTGGASAHPTSFVMANGSSGLGQPTGFAYSTGIHWNISAAVRMDLVISHYANRMAFRSGGRDWSEVYHTDNFNPSDYATVAQLSGYVPTSRTLTINGTTFDLSQNRTWNIPDNDTITRLRGTTSGTYTSGDLTLLAGTNVSIVQSGSDFTINATNTNTTYTAGTGLSLTGTTFGQTITTSGTGSFVTGITQTTNGFQVNLGTPPNTTSNLALGTRTATTMPITNSGGTGVTLPIATTALAGLLSGADKTKLDGIATGANNYVHPNSGVTAGTYNQVTVDAQGHVTAGNNQPYQTNTQVNNAINNAIQPLVDGVDYHHLNTGGHVPIEKKKTIVNIPAGSLGYTINVDDAPYEGYELAINGCGEWSVTVNGSIMDKCGNTDSITLGGNQGTLFWWSVDLGMWIQAI